ncbi:MAG: SpoIIIAH-like family protein [Oscillospiraceae bacterium]|nr:SpoIIIAH-like family protein [Oscillospiraceae bacterium]MBQ5339579.1 SpoIIIAH-like family protein [Oscillospiraceae bacterium]MBQ9906527.1 SpoIIIAH-like family protein [Oscillospiraceae bacterium]MBR5362134.1 SpoIIIAH-like family protein [Oscillospiraceae bacterium]
MKKPTMIIGRKQLILSGLTLVLGAAVYLNYVLAGGTGLVPADLTAEPSGMNAAAEADDLAEYGTAEMVSATPAQADYFAQARLEKQTSRDYAVQTLQSIIGGGDLSNDEMVTNAIDAVGISRQVQSESVIESLILSQGFRDCVVYLDGNSAKVVVESSGLNPAQAAAIKEIILAESDVPAEGIRIFEVAAGTPADAVPAE